jgi:FkbM family methyltransferase
MAYVAAYVLRRTGCFLPIEFWFLPGEMEAIKDCVPLATSVGAVCRVLDTQSMRHVGGWQTKINAIVQTDYRHVLHLDADNIVRNDPTYLFDSPEYEGTGAIFWPDDFSQVSMVTNTMLKAVGLPEDGPHRGFETGQILLDKKRCWPALLMAKHFADYADYWGGVGGKKRNKAVVWYGDKDDFWMAWRLTGCGSVHMERPVFPFNPGGFFEHKDPRGRILFQHVTRSKLSLSEGKLIAELPNRGCCVEAIEGMTPIPWLEPGDIVGAAELISPERHFRLWDDDQTRGVWIDVVRRNEYRLPDKFDSSDVVIDIGGQTGSFAFAAGKRGARVIAFEPYEPSFRRLQHNTQGLNVEAHNVAVLRSDRKAGQVTLHDHSGEYKCGSFTLEHRGATQATWQVEGITLDDVLRQHEFVRLLKMDCEGSEWPLLYTSSELDRVQAVCGEYHEIPQADGEWEYEWNAAGLNQFLVACGFRQIEVCEHLWPWGHFWATR